MEGKERPGEIPWAEMSDAQLKEALVRRGLNTDGSTEQIIQRLRDYDSSHAQKKENPSGTKFLSNNMKLFFFQVLSLVFIRMSGQSVHVKHQQKYIVPVC